MALQIPIISSFDEKGVKKAIAEFKQLEGAGAKAGYAVKKAMLPATAAIGGLAVVLGDAVKAAVQDQQAQVVLADALRKSTGATDAQIAATEEFIAQQGRLFGITDDKLRPAFAQLARASGNLARAQKLTTIAQDIAASTGMDLETVVKAISKAERGQFTALRRLQIPMGRNTKAQIAAAKAKKDAEAAQRKLNEAQAKGDPKKIAAATENLKFAMDRLNESTVKGADYALDLEKAFAGGAANAADTTAGKMQRFKVAIDETKEAIGAAFLPVLEKILPYLQRFADSMQQEKNVKLFTYAILGLAAAYTALSIAQAAQALTNPVGAIVAGVVAVTAALTYLYNKYQGFRDFMNPVMNAFVGYWENLFNVYRQAVNLAIRLFNLLPFTDIPLIPEIKLPRVGQDSPSSGTNVPKMAEGGIVTGPTLALIGEGNESEAVIPLSKLDRMMKGGGGGVVINVNGGDPNAVVDALRRYYRQSGPIPVAVQY